MTIPPFLYGEEYLQNPIMRRILRDHHIHLVDSRAEYIQAIEDYANQNEENEQEVHEWLIKVVKEGTKEFCYKKIYDIAEWQRNPILLEKKISEQFPNCPKRDILSYHNTGTRTMIDYKFTLNKNGDVSKIEFTFSSLFMYGNAGEVGNKTVFPVFIEVYLDEGFIVSREKAKSTLYKYDEENPILIGEYKIDTMEYAISIIKEIVEKLEFHTEGNPKAVKSNVFQMLYRIYDEYAFTPKDIVEKVDSVKGIVNRFVDNFFSKLQLNVRNKEKAIRPCLKNSKG